MPSVVLHLAVESSSGKTTAGYAQGPVKWKCLQQKWPKGEQVMHLLHSFPLRKSKIQNASRNLKTIMTFYQSLPSQVAWFFPRDLWWHDSFQALEEVPVCLELCPSMVSRRLWSWGTHCSLHTPNDLEANRPRSFPLFFAWPNLSSAIQIRDCCLYTLYREHQPNMSRFGVSSFILHAFQQSSPPNFNTKAPFSWSCRSR